MTAGVLLWGSVCHHVKREASRFIPSTLLNGVLTVLLGVALIVAPVAGVLAVLWLIGSFAIVVGILMIVLGFRLKGMKNAGDRRLAYGR